MEGIKAAALTFVFMIVLGVIGQTIASKSYDVGIGLVTNNTSLISIYNSGNSAFSTLYSFLPIIAISLAGAYALYYLGAFGGGKGRE
jgi:hypothetical protein